MSEDTEQSPASQDERGARSRWRRIRDLTDHSTVGQVVGTAIWTLLVAAGTALLWVGWALWSFISGLGGADQSFASPLTVERTVYKDIDAEGPTNVAGCRTNRCDDNLRVQRLVSVRGALPSRRRAEVPHDALVDEGGDGEPPP